MKQTMVTINPLMDFDYSSFYIYGLIKLFGKKNIRFVKSTFKFADTFGALSFIIQQGDMITKYVISYNDSYEINEEYYKWCDVYGSVNANFELTPERYHKKLVSLAPSYSINEWNIMELSYLTFKNFWKVYGLLNPRKYIGRYKKVLINTSAYKEFINENIKTKDNYIFHLSSLWYNDEWNKNDEGVNLARANFIRACKSIEELEFDGGLLPENKSSIDTFKDCLYDKRLSMNEWILRTKRSIMVFNTPAFWNCHGWKLGQYLSMGKAIISTSLSNDLPAPLVHGQNIHLVKNNEGEIKKAIMMLLKNHEYRKKLEEGSKNYWEEYGTPQKSLALLGIKKLNIL